MILMELNGIKIEYDPSLKFLFLCLIPLELSGWYLSIARNS